MKNLIIGAFALTSVTVLAGEVECTLKILSSNQNSNPIAVSTGLHSGTSVGVYSMNVTNLVNGQSSIEVVKHSRLDSSEIKVVSDVDFESELGSFSQVFSDGKDSLSVVCGSK